MTRSTSRVSRVLMSGPLAPFAEEYRLEPVARGYTVRSAVNELRQVARLSRWLGNRGLGARDLSREQIEEFLAFQRRSGRLRSQSRPGLLCLLGVLQARGVAVVPPVPLPSARELLLSSFERYLLVERGLAAGTVAGYLAHAGRFLAGLPAGGLPGNQDGPVVLGLDAVPQPVRAPRRPSSYSTKVQHRTMNQI